MKTYFVYIATNGSKTLYIGMTNDLERRMYEHRNKLVPGFSSRYNIDRLIYFETTSQVDDAIRREKQLKGWRRAKKFALIDALNPDRNDLCQILRQAQDDRRTTVGMTNGEHQ